MTRQEKWELLAKTVDEGNKIMTEAFEWFECSTDEAFGMLMDNYLLMIEQKYGRYIPGFKQKDGSESLPWDLEL